MATSSVQGREGLTPSYSPFYVGSNTWCASLLSAGLAVSGSRIALASCVLLLDGLVKIKPFVYFVENFINDGLIDVCFAWRGIVLVCSFVPQNYSVKDALLQ